MLDLDERCYLDVLIKSLTSVQTFVDKLDDEVSIYLLWVELLYEVASCLHCSAGSKEVVVEQNYVVFADGVLVNLDGVLAVFLCVAFLHGVARKLAGLAAEHYTGSKTEGEGR